ncbi:MAG TPA: metalloregulator ArsR/SmtB family transcription factor [Candidatus Limnocylindrales bacterium]|nr:metalloregulator ArsR/SmtB family transcription factor [Candidatus Limnocylindrales bacterium]
MDSITSMQAEVLTALANPRRLEILHLLAAGPREVGGIAAELGMTQPNASQHLAVMRGAGIVIADRDGREVRYRIADPDVIAACNLMRGVLSRRIARLAALTETATVTEMATVEPPTVTQPTTSKPMSEVVR